MNKDIKKGFTLIELLVVISIIGLIATVSVYAINQSRARSKATRIVRDFQNIEKALHLLIDKENPPRWWREGEKSSNLNSFAGLSTFIKISNPPIAGTYNFDNDGDTRTEGYTGCCNGVNLGLENCGSSCQQYFDLIDKIIEGGNGPYNGKVRSNSSYSYIYYGLSPNENTF